MVIQQTDTPSTLVGQAGREVTRTVERARRSIDVLLGRRDPEVGQTPRDVLYSNGMMKLYH